MKNLRSFLAAQLLEHQMTQDEIDQLEWWKKFVAEIEAIGGYVDSEMSEEGELQVRVPRDKQAEAASIVKKFAAKKPE